MHQRPPQKAALADGQAGLISETPGQPHPVSILTVAEPTPANVYPSIVSQIPYAFLALRPTQWTKNGLVLVALIFAGRLTDITSVVRAMLAFCTFSFAASAIYVVNDIGDRQRDRAHPEKRKRPIASGKVGVPLALCVALLSAMAAAGLTIFLTNAALWDIAAATLGLSRHPYENVPSAQWAPSPTLFVVVMLGYVGMNFAYTAYLKHLVLWDVFVIAAGFVLRAFAGALAIPVPISPWFYLCTLFLALFLALGKRRAELVRLQGAATSTRKNLSEYSQTLLDQLMSVAVACTILTYSLYTFEANTASHTLIITVPLVIFGAFRYLYLVYAQIDGDRPDVLLWRDRQILCAVVLCVLVTVVAIYGLPVLRGHSLLP